MKTNLIILFICVSGSLFAQTPKFLMSEDIESQVSNSVNIYYAPKNVTPAYTNVSPNISIEFDSSIDGIQMAAFNEAVRIWEQFLLSTRAIVNDVGITMPAIRLKVGFNLSASTIVSSKMMTVTDFSHLIDRYYFYNIESEAWYTTVGAKLMVAKWNWDNINDALKNEPDITLSFNTNKDLYYFGTDGAVPSDKYDFVTIVLRELLKGSGFGSSATSKYGVVQFFKSEGVASCFDTRLFTTPNNYLYQLPNITVAAQSGDVYFGSGRFASTKMYAPSTFSKGLSLIYIDTDNASCILKKELKKGEAIHAIGNDIKNIFRDLCVCDIATGLPHSAPLNNAPYTLSGSSYVFNPSQSYSVTSSGSGSWAIRLLKEDGSYYTHGTFSGSSINIPVNYFNNIPNNLSYSYELGGKVRGDILFTGTQGNVSYPIFISAKPPKPYFTIKEVIDVDEWVCDVVFELTSPNASSFRITHDCYDYGYSYDYTINESSHTFTIHDVEKYFTNYFRLFAINSYGESSFTEVILEPLSLNNIQTYSLNLTKSTDKIYLSLKSSSGNSKNINVDEIQTISIARIDNLSKTNVSKNSIGLDGSIDISRFPAGIYAVQIIDKTGKVYREKFIK